MKIIIYLFIMLYPLDSYSKDCIRDTSVCPFFWTPDGKYCISSTGERILKDNFQSVNNVTDSDSTENKYKKPTHNNNEPVWPCNDGEAILLDMLLIEPKPWKGLSLSGPVSHHSGDIVSYNV